jgi:hypothetical protein
MLINPASEIESHFECADFISEWLRASTDNSMTQSPTPLGIQMLDWNSLVQDLQHQESKWIKWAEDYRRASTVLKARPEACHLKSPPDWTAIRATIVKDVLPSIRLKIVNSDEAADEPPMFEPEQSDDGTWRVAPDLCTIFVAGNVMSRGLTLEGLTTTVFLRNPTSAYADTQSQMQRWLGYRGSYLQYCRVFLLKAQYERFKHYRFDDEALRTEIVNRLLLDSSLGANPQVLQGLNYSATAKVLNLRALPLCPGAHPFVSLVSSESGRDPNVESAVRFTKQFPLEPLVANGRLRGLISTSPIALPIVADFLDCLRYPNHDPLVSAAENARWGQLQASISPPSNGARLFRPNSVLQSGSTALLPSQCPYTLAAYLRLWSLSAQLAAPGLLANDLPDSHWSHLSAKERQRRVPRIWLGVRFGAIDPPHGDLIRSIGAELGPQYQLRLMERQIDPQTSRLVSTWGSRNPGDETDSYQGDQYFDYHRADGTGRGPSIRVRDTWWRSPGEPALMLLHFVVPSDVLPTELNQSHVRFAVGLCLPAGGPDQICALRPITTSMASC